mmetsp:Transcript_20428/g.33361  ORF Transcript_20428/g.33361 Transcript_20428/m.33361 type:complete len:91 (+) Transcript_20428:1483-1755(+)
MAMKGISREVLINFKSSGSGLPDMSGGYGNTVELEGSLLFVVGIRPVRCQTIRVSAKASDRDSRMNFGRSARGDDCDDVDELSLLVFPTI